MNSADDLGPMEDQVPGSGTVDFGALIDTLEENNYFGMYTFLWGGTPAWSEDRTVEAINSARSHVLKVSKG
jgi:sugar phosphate isomerase/epimerase